MKIKLDKNAKLPVRATDGSAGYDITANITDFIDIYPSQTVLVPTGLYMAIPTDQVGMIYPRSSLGIKGISLANTVGVIDSDYRGEIKVALKNTSTLVFRVKPHDRIAQMVFTKVEVNTMEVVDSLDDTERGIGGFGSTGSS